MPEGLLIAQVSDCHVSADSRQTYRGINPHKNLKALMKRVKSLRPDMLLATGDLSEDGSRKSYQLLKKYLSLAGVPVLALPGNHDDPQLLAEAFPGSPVDTIAVSDHGPWQIIRLNSCVPRRPEGLLSETSLADLEEYLSSAGQKPKLIAVHHQPLPVGNPWIDRYPLENAADLMRIVDQCADVKAVVWGHIHHAFRAERSGVAMLGGPSSAINSLQDVQRFTADPAGPAFRWVKLKADASLESGISVRLGQQ
jgi:Icc protein